MSEITPPTGGAPVPPVEPAKPTPLTFTQAEFDAKIEAAKASERDAAKQAKEAADAESQRKADEAKGEWEKVAKAAEAERDTLKREKADRERGDNIRNAVKTAGKGKDGYTDELLQRYVADRLLLTLPANASGEAIAQSAKAGVEEYVKDNPRVPQRQAGVPRPTPATTEGKSKRPTLETDPVGHILAGYGGPRLPNRT